MFDQERKANCSETDDTPRPILHRRRGSQDTRNYFLGLLKKEHNAPFRLQTFNKARDEFMQDAARHWKSVFLSINLVLDGMDRGLLRGEDIRVNLSVWRVVLGTCRYHLVQYQRDLRGSLEILKDPEAPDLEVQATVQEEYHALLSDAKELGERVERTFQSVASTMSILESKSAIAEAHSIGRLTELASIFVPLSFVSSFYGMGVKVSLSVKCMCNEESLLT